jgi:hypothetical protein
MSNNSVFVLDLLRLIGVPYTTFVFKINNE